MAVEQVAVCEGLPALLAQTCSPTPDAIGRLYVKGRNRPIIDLKAMSGPSKVTTG